MHFCKVVGIGVILFITNEASKVQKKLSNMPNVTQLVEVELVYSFHICQKAHRMQKGSIVKVVWKTLDETKIK